ncbi:cell envelope integrity protein TolA [bacterium]|nr:cell envelope integrity protein TolA [bacterium]
MFFEDEKDNIRGAADISIQEDGTVTWEDVLSGDSDDDLIIQDNSSSAKSSSNSKINLGDELELVDTSADDVDDQELIQMLSEEQPAPSVSNTPTPDITYDTPDIDSQIKGAFSNQQSADDDEIVLTPRKSETKQSTSAIIPLFIAILVAGIVGYGAWYAINYFSNQESLNKEAVIPTQQTPQQEMNEINQEMLEQRQAEPENIPVVNEEQANEVTPQEQEQEKVAEVAAAKVEPKQEKPEKRQVISVVPTGRTNPFLPISKYMTTSIPDTNVDFDSAGIPKPPESYGSREGETIKLMSIAVSGIMYDETKPSAIITYDNNDYFVQKGDKLDDYKVLDIARTYVTLSHGANVYKANIGEEFKVSSKFYGSAQFMPQAQGGGRQYYSIEAQNRAVGLQPSSRYVSEDDITINTK